MERQYQFKSLAGISKWLKTFLILSFLTHLVLLALTWLAAAVVSGDILSIGGIFVFYRFMLWFAIATVLNGLVLICCGISYFAWLYIANSNVHAAGAEGIRAPAWAVGGYFIPVANIFLGIESVREVWRASKSPKTWTELPTTGWVPIWWGFWFVGNLVLAFVDLDRPTNIAVIASHTIGRTFSYVSILIAITALVAIVCMVANFQE